MEDQFAKIAALIGDPVRAKILWALLDGRAYTATELSVYTDTSASNISMHLSKLVNADLLSVQSQGRHRYYNYARPDIALAIEALANLIPKDETKKTNTARVKPVEYCRSCYDHLAGTVGVSLTENLLRQEILYKKDGDFEVSEKGAAWFEGLGISIEELRKQKRVFAKSCLDWSERRHHLAGSLGAALLTTMLSNGWLRKTKDSRAILITGKGSEMLYKHLKIVPHNPKGGAFD